MNGRYIGEINADGTLAPGNQFALSDCKVDENGYCYVLDENGVQQQVYARGANGRYMALRFTDGAYCRDENADSDGGFLTRMDNIFGGRGCPRWN